MKKMNDGIVFKYWFKVEDKIQKFDPGNLGQIKAVSSPMVLAVEGSIKKKS